MDIRYTDDLDRISAAHLHGFFVGWAQPPSPATHLRLLHQSTHALVAIDESLGSVVGFITALSDGVLSAYIPLLEVLPGHRGHGIGSELVRRMLGRLDGCYMVDLLCDENLQSFYEKLGMRRASGMMIRAYAHQAGPPSGSSSPPAAQ